VSQGSSCLCWMKTVSCVRATRSRPRLVTARLARHVQRTRCRFQARVRCRIVCARQLLAWKACKTRHVCLVRPASSNHLRPIRRVLRVRRTQCRVAGRVCTLRVSVTLATLGQMAGPVLAVQLASLRWMWATSSVPIAPLPPRQCQPRRRKSSACAMQDIRVSTEAPALHVPPASLRWMWAASSVPIAPLPPPLCQPRRRKSSACAMQDIRVPTVAPALSVPPASLRWRREAPSVQLALHSQRHQQTLPRKTRVCVCLARLGQVAAQAAQPAPLTTIAQGVSSRQNAPRVARPPQELRRRKHAFVQVVFAKSLPV
jgi:hypothetical protein